MSAEDWTLADFRRHVPRIIAERDAALAEVGHLRGCLACNGTGLRSQQWIF